MKGPIGAFVLAKICQYDNEGIVIVKDQLSKTIAV